MPLYDYKCPVCDRKHQESHGMNESPIVSDCAKCKVKLVKVFGLAAVTFNGNGFYSTDKKKSD